jgi:tetratricopeptide (TPR) repeat protein
MDTNIATKMSSEESDEENEEINFAQINYNKIMYDALNAYQQGDLSETIKNYNLALDFVNNSTKDISKLTLLKANLGIVLYQNCEYKKGIEMLEEALILIKSQNSKTNEFHLPLLIKILVLFSQDFSYNMNLFKN